MNRIFRLTFVACAVASFDSAHAGNQFVRINEIMAGLNADSGIQFVELAVRDETQKQWGPRGEETAGRCELVFTNSAGVRTGRFVFPNDPPFGASTVLVATAEFEAFTGIVPDFIMPRLVMPLAGKVSFQNNPDNAAADAVSVSLSYGGLAFTGGTDGAGAPHLAKLAIMDSQSLRRVAHFDPTSFGTGGQLNADFAPGTPTPASTRALGAAVALAENTAGEVTLPGAASTIKQGENLFVRETFLGNGRTCATCHPQSQRFSLPSARVSALPTDDPLFVMDANVNTLVLGGTAKVLAGSGTTYQIIGGATLAIAGNVIADARGNRGTFATFTAGNLAGPTPTNADPFGIERNNLLRSPQVLILENINGFTQTSFMRTVPSVMNVKRTAPYGWSVDFPDLESLSIAAIEQHTPRSLNRVQGTVFRPATAAELAAITAFQNDLNLPANENFDEVNRHERFLTTPQQRIGRDLFFGAVAKCAACHGGKTLSQSDGRFGTIAGVNQSFNTGVHNQPQDAGLPTEQNAGAPANSRAFSVPALMGVGRTEPFFHDGVFTGDAQFTPFFYVGSEFANSPAAATVGPIFLTPGDVTNIGAFLNAVGEEPQSPVISGVVATQNQVGVASLRPFPNVTVTDATVPAQTLTVTVALDDAAKGTLSSLGSFALSEPGTWTFSGTAAAARTALRALVFDHAPNRTPIGLTERTRFTIGVNDGVATTLFNDTTTIVSTTVATPALTPIGTLTTLNTGASIPVAFSIAGLDTAAADFTLTASSSAADIVAPGSIQFGGAGTMRTITLTPAAGASGVTTITITASQGGQTIVRTFEVTVVPFIASIAPGIGAHNFTFTAQPGQKYAIKKPRALPRRFGRRKRRSSRRSRR